MQVDVTDIATFLVVSLASGRVAFCLTKDDIFQGLRERIWMHSAPEDGMVVERTADGDLTRPARAYHRVNGPQANIGDTSHEHRYDPGRPFRTPGFWGQLWECPYCMSFWTSALACVAWLVLGDAVMYPATPFAVWAVANLYAVKGLL